MANAIGTATLDFGAAPGSNEASVAVADTGVGAGSYAETAAQRYELLMRALQDEVAQSLLRLEYERLRFEEDEEDIALLLLH